uniref:Uncharacterized protein n=1 Tax=Cucumis melo TaxID=3656 RepID=A0A9I9EFU1_CUCME
MVLTMPISTSFGMSFESKLMRTERGIMPEILPSGLTSVSKPRWKNKFICNISQDRGGHSPVFHYLLGFSISRD